MRVQDFFVTSIMFQTLCRQQFEADFIVKFMEFNLMLTN